MWVSTGAERPAQGVGEDLESKERRWEGGISGQGKVTQGEDWVLEEMGPATLAQPGYQPLSPAWAALLGSLKFVPAKLWVQI